VLSERPLSAGGEVGNRIYRSRGALRVVRITKIRPRGEAWGKKGGARSPRRTASLARSGGWNSRGLSMRREAAAAVAVTAPRRTFYLVALSGGWKGRSCQESSPFFFILHSFEIPLAARSIESRGSRVPWEKDLEREAVRASVSFLQNSEFRSLSSGHKRRCLGTMPSCIVDLCSSMCGNYLHSTCSDGSATCEKMG